MRVGSTFQLDLAMQRPGRKIQDMSCSGDAGEVGEQTRIKVIVINYIVYPKEDHAQIFFNAWSSVA